LLLANAMHITASVVINDNESGLHADYQAWLERLARHAPTAQYQHNRTGEDNADAHLKRQIMGARSGGGHHQRQAGFWAVEQAWRWTNRARSHRPIISIYLNMR
jgi:thiamine phosphate synthase YjbQ (UPF0047 family)